MHDWQIDSLAAPSATNAWVEGDDFSSGATAATTKLRNYCQIARKDFVVTRTSNVVNTAGRKQELAYQITKKGRELKRDIESQLLQNAAATAGGSASARVSAGVETWIYTNNHIKAASQTTNSTPAPVNGIAGTAPTDGSATALTSTELQAALQQAWSCGGEVGVILAGPSLKNKIGTFTGLATRFRDVGSRQQAQVINAADVFVSDFGAHDLVISRYMRTTTVLCLDMNYWAVAWLDGIHMENIAKSGDSEKRMLVCEYTLEARNPLASTKIGNVT